MGDKILIVDDDALMCRLLNIALKREGYQSHAVYSGSDALGYLAENEVDLVLLDVMMADLNGFDVLRRIKQQDKTADVPVIFLTARVDSRSRQAGLEIGAVEYLTKPITPERLTERVRAVLAMYA